MNKPVETVKHKNHVIEIHYDDSPINPMQDFDYLGTFVCWHRTYNLGHKHDFNSPQDFKQFREENEIAICLPLYAYIHSGITISTGTFHCPWDSGQIGYTYLTKEKFLKEYGEMTDENLAKAESAMKAEVNEYDDFLTGQVYRYIIKDEDDEEYESANGFSGYDSIKNMIEECKSLIDNRIETIAKGLPEAVLI